MSYHLWKSVVKNRRAAFFVWLCALTCHLFFSHLFFTDPIVHAWVCRLEFEMLSPYVGHCHSSFICVCVPSWILDLWFSEDKHRRTFSVQTLKWPLWKGPQLLSTDGDRITVGTRERIKSDAWNETSLQLRQVSGRTDVTLLRNTPWFLALGVLANLPPRLPHWDAFFRMSVLTWWKWHCRVEWRTQQRETWKLLTALGVGRFAGGHPIGWVGHSHCWDCILPVL